MSAKVHLKISEGKDVGKIFAFTEHDTFVFGRMDDCHACIPDDTQVSRHHFILEVNPPAACLRDLGSLNGTHVNVAKFGAREKGETPEQGAKGHYPEVTLKHGDCIKVGRTELEVSIEQPKEAPSTVLILNSGTSHCFRRSSSRSSFSVHRIRRRSRSSKSPAARSKRKSDAEGSVRCIAHVAPTAALSR